LLNGIYVLIVVIAVLVAATSGRMDALTNGIVTSARSAVDLAIRLVGVMAFFLGLMKVAEDAGILRTIARKITPVMRLLFPGVPAGHPAMSSMILNITSNMLGLANAATPFGIKAIEQLNTLNSRTGTATNDMVLFLAINTAGLAILPSGIASLRASLGSENAFGIFFTTWVASGTATIIGISAAFLYSRLPSFRGTQPPPIVPAWKPEDETDADDLMGEDGKGAKKIGGLPIALRRVMVWLFWAVFVIAAVVEIRMQFMVNDTPAREVLKSIASWWVLPALVAAIVLFGWSRGARVYDSLVEGAKEGFQVAIRIIPYLVAILVGVGMLRDSGVIAVFTRVYEMTLAAVGLSGAWLPAEALPMALLRPLSGSGAYGLASEIMTAHGPDSYVGYLVSTMQGSTETTFYVLAVYFGAVGVKNSRHALPACLTADVAGLTAAVLIVYALFG